MAPAPTIDYAAIKYLGSQNATPSSKPPKHKNMPPRRQKRTTTSLGDGWSLVSSSGSAPPHARAQMPTQPQPDLPLTPHDLMLLCDDINTYIARLTALPPSPYPLPSGITSAACVGLGPFALPGPAYARGKAQIAAFLAFFRFKTGVVRRVAQDPAFRRADKDGLKALEIDVVDAPGITAEIGEGSVVYAPFLGWAVMLTQVLPRWWEAEGRGRPKAVVCLDIREVMERVESGVYGPLDGEVEVEGVTVGVREVLGCMRGFLEGSRVADWPAPEEDMAFHGLKIFTWPEGEGEGEEKTE